MKDYKMVEGYSLFKQLNVDLLGTNHRAGKIVDGKVTGHFLFTEVYPFLYKDEDAWKRIELLLNGVKKSKISNLYSPEIILNKDDKFLVYPFMDGVSLEKILEDSTGMSIPINFDLALSIAMGIADLLDAGSSIAVSGKRSFHGFLTPDNIIIDHDGNIWVKNYGIYAYLNGSDEIQKELEMKYGPWVTPEFLRKEKPLPQSDIYHLGYVIYKMMTGSYFSLSEGDDFESKLSSISFLHHIPATDKDFLNNIILFFKKTLNPDPEKRFSSIREFKEFISNYFNIEELSSVTFNIAYFMSSLYSKEIIKTEKEIAEEKKYIVPSKKKEMERKNDSKDSHIVENLLSGLEDQEKSKSKGKLLLVVAVLAVIAIAIGIYSTFLGDKKEGKQAATEIKAVKMETAEKARENARLKEKIIALQKKADEAKKKEENAKKEAEDIKQQILNEKDIKKKEELKKKQDDLKKEAEEEKKKADDAKAEEEKIMLEKKKADDAKAEEERIKLKKKKAEEEKRKSIKEGDLVADVDQRPVEIDTTIPELSRKLRKKIAGDSVQAIVSVLVDENGKVRRIKITKKTGIPEIDMELSRIINSWKFKPAIKYDKKVKTWFTKVLIIKK